MQEVDRIEEALTEHWGEKCPDYEPGCPTCDAWHQFDAIVALARRTEALDQIAKQRAEKERKEAAAWDDYREMVFDASQSREAK